MQVHWSKFLRHFLLCYLRQKRIRTTISSSRSTHTLTNCFLISTLRQEAQVTTDGVKGSSFAHRGGAERRCLCRGACEQVQKFPVVFFAQVRRRKKKGEGLSLGLLAHGGERTGGGGAVCEKHSHSYTLKLSHILCQSLGRKASLAVCRRRRKQKRGVEVKVLSYLARYSGGTSLQSRPRESVSSPFFFLPFR